MPAGRLESRHVGPGGPWRWLLRRPAAAAVLCCGLLAVGGGAGGLVLLTQPGGRIRHTRRQSTRRHR
jgi:hypothetical protein